MKCWQFVFKFTKIERKSFSCVLSGYFYVYVNLTGFLLFPNLAEFRDTAPLKGKIRKFHVA